MQVDNVSRVTFELRHEERPWTVNAERRLHHMQRHVLVKNWRKAFQFLALEADAPQDLIEVSIIATPYLRNRAGVQDVGAAFPAVKAAIDGLVDAGVMEDDNPSILKFIGFKAPVFGQGNALQLEITGEARAGADGSRRRKQHAVPRSAREEARPRGRR